MNGVHYVGPRDFDRLEMLEPFDVLIFGKGASDADVVRLRREFPAKVIGKYYMTAFELSPTEEAEYKAFCELRDSNGQRKYPAANMSNRYTGVGRVIGLMHEGTVAWHAQRAAASIGSADLLMSDNSDPKQPIGFPYSAEELVNWREWTPTVFAAVKEAIGEAKLICNVGHTVNPASVSNPDLVRCYSRFAAAVNGIGVEKKTGSTIATYTYSTFLAPFRSPRLSLAFAQDEAAWNITDGMLLPSYVTKSCVKWVVAQEWINS